MGIEAHDVDDERFELLNVYCARLGKGWLVHLRPTFVPSWFMQCFDRDLEARVAELDFEDLDRYMGEHEAAYETRRSSTGGVELVARGKSAPVLSDWLATALGSGVRVR